MGKTLRILSFGAGAIGTYVGGSLALGGHRVVFLERPEVAGDLRQRGVSLQINGQERTIQQVEMATSLEAALSLGPFDVALFALKSYDTSSALESMQPYRDQLPPVLCLQNGVENEPALAAVLGDQQVIPGTVTSAVGRQAVGAIVLEKLRGLGLAAGHPLSRTLADTMEAVGLRPRLYAHALGMKWSKLLTNLLGNATSAILDLPPAQIFTHPGLYRLEIDQLREALAVMSAQQIPVVDLPGTPVRLLAFGIRFLPPSLSRPLMSRAVGGGRGGKMPSFHIDLYSGRGRSEVDYLNGAVVRAGHKAGIPTPANRLLNDTLLSLTRGEIPLNTFAEKPEKLLNLFYAYRTTP